LHSAAALVLLQQSRSLLLWSTPIAAQSNLKDLRQLKVAWDS